MSMAEERSPMGVLSKLDFLSTHPANEKRIAKINQWLPEVRTMGKLFLPLSVYS
jgi:Zn-dependent protease with chaperone function